MPLSVAAQTCPTTTVSGTITDPQGFAYSFATVTFVLSPSVSSPLCNGLPIFAQGPAVTFANGAGQFSLNLPQTSSISPGGETYTVQVNGTAQGPPIGTGPQFFQITGVTTTGATLSLSATLSAAAPALTNIAGAGSGGANRTLSNLLAPTALNQDLLCASSGSCNLGNGTTAFNDVTTAEVDFSGSVALAVQGAEGTPDVTECNAGFDAFAVGDATTHTILECDNGGAYFPIAKVLTSSGAPVGTGQVFQLDIDTTNHVFYFWTGAAWSSNAATSTALAATPTNCGAGVAATGIAANGNAVGCFTPSGTSGISAPQGRLTLTSGSPVMTADATAQTTVFYDSYVGQTVPIFNGTSWTTVTITANEVSMGLDATVPHIASGSLYDVFAVNSSGLAICAGPAWSTTTSRGTGAGTTQIHRQSASGLWTNQNALTNCWGGASGLTNFGSVPVDQATYLGTLDATANGQTSMQFKPTAAAGGSNNILGLYNAYNRTAFSSLEEDSTASWTYASTTWRQADGSNSNRITYVDGLQQSPISVTVLCFVANNAATATAPAVGANLNSTTATPAVVVFFSGIVATSGNGSSVTAEDSFNAVLGLNFVQAMEVNLGSNTAKFQGSGNQALRLRVPM